MDTKICSRCSLEKSVTEFCKWSRSKDGYQPACKSCMNISYTRSRKKKQQHYQQVAKDRQDRNVKRLQEWRSHQKCVKCGEDDFSCLDLHHLDPSSKDGDISDLVRRYSWKRLTEEIDKCIVLCSNCHRKYHAGRLKL